MNFPVDYIYRLARRGGAGLACDAAGVALGAADLARVHREAGGRRRCEVRPPSDIGRVLKAAYGPQPDAVVQRLHRGLIRTAKQLEAGDLCQAGVEAVMLGFPDLTPTAMAKLAEIADLEKRGAPWEDEPRVPAGQAGGGRWTTGGGAPTAAASAKPVLTAAPAVEADRPAAPSRPKAPTPPEPRAQGASSGATLDDGVYYFGPTGPRPIAVAIPPGEELPYRSDEAAQEEAEGPAALFALPTEFGAVEDLFSGLKNKPNAPADWNPAAQHIDYAAFADDVGPNEAAEIYHHLQAETKAIDPKYNDTALLPKGGFTSLSGPDMHRVIDDVLLDRASADYRVRGDPRKLQIETVKFLKKTVDHYYAEGEKKFDAGLLKPRLSREEAVGNYVDQQTRRDLQRLFSRKGIPYGRGQRVAINNRDYDTSQPGKPSYRVPDLRIGDAPTGDVPDGEARIGSLTIDWTIRMKQPSDPQIQGFFHGDSKPKAVVTIAPSQRFPPGARYIPRAAAMKGN
jgi:hypothetical protein